MTGMDREKDVLIRFLDQQRSHVFGILDGLTDEQLRKPTLPSGWSCLGLVKHLALGDEHYWFRCIMGGEPLDFFPEGRGSDWEVGSDESADDILALYRDEIAHSNAIIEVTSLDTPPRQDDPWWGEWSAAFTDFRYIMMHVIAETACHAGHLDAAAELIDHRQWVVN
jgi:uncharacterized protein DUF664